ncbi:MAG: glycosyltransferase [Litoreibacter sp.]|uniref:glycosyltransferase family 2 protein n=1 Tax=Litoreibacter sp. TaxID=1969459 RepID=UPI003299DBCF
MNRPLVSVVVVSRHRPEELRRCVRALDYQTYGRFEVVLVTDTKTSQEIADLVPIDRVKHAVCGEANISKARNIGIEISSGEVVAFIDDDAIAEPTWLQHLIAPFEDQSVGASGGFVRGRNGISFQWQAEEITSDGRSHLVDVTETTVPQIDPNKAIKTQGTNCAFRREALVELSGFDENYHFYLDETDLNIRLTRAGWRTAIVPLAEVQHGYAASSMRGQDRRPKSLFQIGASQSYFGKKNGRPEHELDVLRKEQKHRLESALIGGLIEPSDVGRLQADLELGIEDGRSRVELPARDWAPAPEFNVYQLDGAAKAHRFVSGRWLSRRRVYERAKELADQGFPCTAIVLSVTALFHKRYFHSDGYWVQSGGIFGKSTRGQAFWSWYRHSTRVAEEQKQLKRTR